MEIKRVIVLLIVLTFASDGACLEIGAFNIRIFGSAKMKDATVVDILVKTISRYDVLLIQEIRDVSGEAINELLKKVNMGSPSNTYNMTLSRRLGHSISKEQYAFLYREKSGVKIERAYVYGDGDEGLSTETVDKFERNPYVVLFNSSETTVDKFALIGLHVSPSKAVKELQALEPVFADTKSRLKVDNVMVLGDLNAGCTYVKKTDWINIPLKNDSNYTWWIGDDLDTTVTKSGCAYDRFISTGDQLKGAVVKGSVGIFQYDLKFNLNKTMALKVSDHYPIEMSLQTRSTYLLNGCSPCIGNLDHVCFTVLTILSVVFSCENYLEFL